MTHEDGKWHTFAEDNGDISEFVSIVQSWVENNVSRFKARYTATKEYSDEIGKSVSKEKEEVKVKRSKKG